MSWTSMPPDRRFVLDFRESPDDAVAEAAAHLVFLDRREADQDHDAVAEHDRVSVGADPECERSGRDDVAALEARGVDALAQMQGPSGDARRWCVGQGHGADLSGGGC